MPNAVKTKPGAGKGGKPRQRARVYTSAARVALTPDMRSAIEQIADSYGVGMSVVLREAVLEGLPKVPAKLEANKPHIIEV